MDFKQPAGFWPRFGARLLDSAILGITISLLSLVIFGEVSRDYPYLNVMNMVYFVVLPIVWHGYTIGKKAAGVRIVQKNGQEAGVGRLLAREVVGSLIYAFTLGIALIVSAFMVGMREDKRAIHDMIAGTYVTKLTPDASSQQTVEGKHA